MKRREILKALTVVPLTGCVTGALSPLDSEAVLRAGNPSIEVMNGPRGSINVTVHMLKPEQVKIVAFRIKEELMKASV